ncbi:MAG: immunity 53 family protein [Opitutales bacterium]|nr:immunity 53 family protein [Opitutales bacterium]
MDKFGELVSWFRSNCNGDWEHLNELRIFSLDNPGWRLIVSFRDTPLEKKEFESIKSDVSSDDWMFCSVKDEQFEGACSFDRLNEMISVFLDWIDS